MKAIVLSSGGIDSTTCISLAVDKYGEENVVTVTMYYGQKLAKEIESARKIAEHYGLRHYEFDLSEVFRYSDCSLIAGKKDVVHEDYESQVEKGGIISSYVPFRNGLMLSVCATLAMSLFPEDESVILLGNHASDFAYSDCSEAFTEKMREAILEGTYGKVNFVSPFVFSTKSEVVKVGLRLGTPYQYTWSCYEGREKPCGVCASCIERKRAFEENGAVDPVEYENDVNE